MYRILRVFFDINPRKKRPIRVNKFSNLKPSIEDRTPVQYFFKGGFFPESEIRFLALQISKKKIFQKNYLELEI